MKKMIIFLAIILLVCPFVSGYFLKQIIQEGDTIILEENGRKYTINLLAVSDGDMSATFVIDGELAKNLKDRDEYRLEDGSVIFIRKVMPDNVPEPDYVQFNFFPSGQKVIEDNVTEEEIMTEEIIEELPNENIIIEKVEPVLIEEPVEESEEVLNITEPKEEKHFWSGLVWWFKTFFSFS